MPFNSVKLLNEIQQVTQDTSRTVYSPLLFPVPVLLPVAFLSACDLSAEFHFPAILPPTDSAKLP